MISISPARGWLPSDRQAAVCFTIDDVHPQSSNGDYEAGGDLERGVLGRVAGLLARHPKLRATLFATPDWRERSPVPTRTRLARVPFVNAHVHLAPPRRRSSFRLDRHREFVEYITTLPRTDVGLHGFRHLQRGLRPPAEFAGLRRRASEKRLRKALAIARRAGLRINRGFAPPDWALSPGLATSLNAQGFRWVTAARDLRTPPGHGARSTMTGPNAPLIEPGLVDGVGLVHFTTNFQATSDFDRADRIIDCGGLVVIKAHAIPDALGQIALDGLTPAYVSRLDDLFDRLDSRWGSSLWWTTLEQIAAECESR